MGNAKDNGTETAESQVDSVVEEQQAKTDPTKTNNDIEGQDNKKTVNHKSDENKKCLFVCCDGTWENAASSTPSHSTNVARFARCVGRLEPEAYETKSGRKDNVFQVVWYSGGIGTKESIFAEETWAALTGAGIISDILDADYFLSSSYNFGHQLDEIILIGYSRGAFTVQCLAAFISTGMMGTRRNSMS